MLPFIESGEAANPRLTETLLDLVQKMRAQFCQTLETNVVLRVRPMIVFGTRANERVGLTWRIPVAILMVEYILWFSFFF